MFSIIRQLLFLMSPEKAHYVTLDTIQFLLRIPGINWVVRRLLGKTIINPVLCFGLEFPNHVGLAAGFDKDAKYLEVWKALGFGHIEIGTLTPLAQPGNDKPRLFRLPKDRAIINRMGFNNLGVEQAVNQLKKRPANLIIGGNIGKNKITPNEEAASDYLKCFIALYDYVDYFTVNVSSPNTPGLRALQDKDELLKILSGLINQRNLFLADGKPYKAILLKIAPDLTDGQLNDIITLKKELPFDGIIANNTTISRDSLTSSATLVNDIGAGGLSGAPLTARSQEVLSYLRKHLPDTTIIGVGGIMNKKDGLNRLGAGANLLQVYTGFIYRGPKLVKELA